MDNKLFDQLLASTQEMDQVLAGDRQPSRQIVDDGNDVKAIRRATGLSQSKFAKALDVDIGTLRNWEQGRRCPTGPARALLRAIKHDPKHVLQALAG